jgi:hypothetical protein
MNIQNEALIGEETEESLKDSLAICIAAEALYNRSGKLAGLDDSSDIDNSAPGNVEIDLESVVDIASILPMILTCITAISLSQILMEASSQILRATKYLKDITNITIERRENSTSRSGDKDIACTKGLKSTRWRFDTER